ncbi:calcium-binding protein [Hyphococcus flavus]|uniref:Calcium-binding protein n=1 Tax=Hyphococcus flavus TaxID=1866326 RepID=A0AAF0CGM2_9PROT|nr:calcium-binding protein [Hyphococcus flavus]WDI30837.1 calcium-binding protein [Hyphococcus flavus]
MALSNLNLLSGNAYFALLYDMIKQRENPWLYNGTGFERIHNGGGDGNPTFGYGFNLAAFSASIVEQVILHAYSNSLTGQQGDGLDLILDWKTGAAVFIDGQARTLTNADIINLADVSLNGAPGAVGSTAQRAAVQSLSLNDAQATRMLDVMIKGDLNLVHIEGPSGSWGYEDGLDYRLAEEGVLPYSVERAALLSVYYNAPSLIGPGVQNAVANDDRPQLWYEIRYNHNHFNHNGLQNRRAEESDLLGLVSQAAKDNPALYIDEFAFALNTLFNDFDRLGNRILTRIEARDGLDNFEDAIAPELQALLDYYVLAPLGAASAPTIDFVQADDAGISETMIGKSTAGEGVPGGTHDANTVNLILGMGGNDFIRGLGGPDYLYGGDGDDTIEGDGAGTPSGSEGHDLINGGSGNDLLIAGYGDEYIIGGTGDDVIVAGAGNDAANGGAGNDSLDGALGDDLLVGSTGNDTIDGGAGLDVIFGGDGEDMLMGGSGRDVLAAGVKNDVLDGEGGNDELYGGANNDLLMGGDGDDTMFGAKGVDTLEGGDGNDIVSGAADNDFIDGGEGDDLIFGGVQNDLLTGGLGNDTFLYNAGNDIDVITDFVAGAGTEDVIELNNFGTDFDTFAEVMAAATDDGTDTTINFGSGNLIILYNVLVADLHQDDFVFG